MRITRLAVQRWQISLIASLLVALLGLQAFLDIPRSVDPHFPMPVVIAVVQLPGANAQEMEEAVATPLERALQGLDHIREVRSYSVAGVSRVVAEFEHGTDADQSLDRVVREIGAARARLPQGIAGINITRPRTTEAAALQLALISDGANWQRMSKYADDLRDRLDSVAGVRATAIYGEARPEVRVALDADRLHAAAIPMAAVSTALAQGGLDQPAGSVTTGGARYNIETGGAYRSLDAIREIPVRAGDGRLLQVGDVAEVGWAEAEQLHVTRLNGQRALFVTVLQKDNVDAGGLRQSLGGVIEQFRAALPPDMRLAIGFDQSQDIRRRLSHLARDFLIALALVLVTLAPLGLRPSLIVMLAIPFSLAIGVLLLRLLGQSLNQISVAGFIISLGLLVDDSIVVTENIERRLRAGDSPIDAALNGVREIGGAVVGATAVLLFAFLPLAFLPEASGDFVRGLPLAVIATVTGSLVVSITVIPFVASRFLRPHGGHGNALLRGLMRGIDRLYAPVLRHALDRPRRWFWGTMAICAAAIGLVPVIGFSLFPAADTPYLLVRVELPEGSAIEATERVVTRVSARLAREPDVVDRMENIGAGNPQIFYNVLRHDESANYGDIFVTLRHWDAMQGPQMVARLRAELGRDPDAHISVLTFQNGPPVEAPIAVRLSGPNLVALKRLADRVISEMAAMKGLRDLHNPLALDRTDLELGLDPAKAGMLGVAPGAAQHALRIAISGETASQFRDEEGDSWPVTVRLPMQGRPTLRTLDSVYVPTSAGTSVPLLEIARPRLESGPPQISRRAFQRSVTVTAEIQPGELTTRLTRELGSRLAAIPLQPGYAISFGGEAEAATRNFAGLWRIVLLGVFGIFMVLLLEFGQFRETVVVAGIVPLGMLGGLVALYLTGNSLSFLATIGFIALIGIEIKNSILLVDLASRLRTDGLPLKQAIERAGEMRFFPVLLTSVTAIGGLAPLALGGSALYAPLAWVIIGGLVTSTLLSRIVTPVMYLLALRGSGPQISPGDARGERDESEISVSRHRP